MKEEQLTKVDEYDEKGNLKAEHQFVYDDLGRISEITSLSYEENGILSEKVVYPITYDQEGRLLQHGDANSDIYTKYEYNENGEKIRIFVEIPGGITSETLYQYDKNGLLHKSIFSYDQWYTHISTYTYNAQNQITEVDESLVYHDEKSENKEYTTTYSYDQYGNLVKIIDPFQTVLNEYDEKGRMIASTTEYENSTRSQSSCRYDYEPFEIDQSTFISENDVLISGSANIYDKDGNSLWSIWFGQGKYYEDESGRLIKIVDMDDSSYYEFFYE